MDGVHDLGGMHGFGPVDREGSETPFHGAWEPAVHAMVQAGRMHGVFNIDEFRHAIERMNPSAYLGVTYYEKWLDAFARLLVEKGVVAPEELERRQTFFQERPDVPARAAVAGPLPDRAPVSPDWQSFIRASRVPPRFKVGDAVVTRRAHPHGHTRLPRYARGKRGVIALFHGIHVFPDTHAHGLGEEPQPLYSVRFDAVELWGESAEANAALHLDCWESYLEPAEGGARG